MATLIIKTIFIETNLSPKPLATNSSCSTSGDTANTVAASPINEHNNQNSSEWWISDAELELIQLTTNPCKIIESLD